MDPLMAVVMTVLNMISFFCGAVFVEHMTDEVRKKKSVTIVHYVWIGSWGMVTGVLVNIWFPYFFPR